MALNGFAASLFAFGRKANKLKGRHGLWRPLFLPLSLGGWLTRKTTRKNTIFFGYGALCPIFFVFLPCRSCEIVD